MLKNDIILFMKKLYTAFCFFGLLLCLLTGCTSTKQTFNYVVHAAGGLDGFEYLNCQEAFLKYFENGQTYIEIDFAFTRDNQVVCTHTFSEHMSEFSLENRPTLEEFENYLLEGKYHGMTYAWLLEQLKTNQDVCIIFDTKEEDSMDLLSQMVKIANEQNFDINSRFIIQVYSTENYEELQENFSFKKYWFSNYKSNYSFSFIKSYFENKQDVETIVIFQTKWQDLHESGIDLGKKIAVHTVNNPSEIKFFANNGVDYIFVDYIN